MRIKGLCIFALLLCGLGFSLAVQSDDENGTITIANQTSSNVNVNLEDGWCCEVEANAHPCDCHRPVGKHTLTATCVDNGAVKQEEFELTTDGYSFTMTDCNP